MDRTAYEALGRMFFHLSVNINTLLSENEQLHAELEKLKEAKLADGR